MAEDIRMYLADQKAAGLEAESPAGDMEATWRWVQGRLRDERHVRLTQELIRLRRDLGGFSLQTAALEQVAGSATQQDAASGTAL